MTWQGKRRKQLPGNWGTIRKAVLVRDGYRCTALREIPDPVFREIRRLQDANDTLVWQRLVLQHGGRCPSLATEVHHINGPTDHRLESLRSICACHHNLETQAEAKQAQAKARALNPPINPRLRPKTKHPGLA